MGLNALNRTLVAKIESTYGVDSLPLPATDGVLLRSAEISPLELETVEHTVVRPYLGNYKQLVAGRMVRMTVEVPMTGFGSAGPASPLPGLDALLRCCGLARTISAGVSVTYTPINTGFQGATLKFYQDGTLHTLLGVRGTPSFVLRMRDVPVYRFELTGLYVPVADAALVQPTLSGYPEPLPVAFGNTTVANFLGSATGVCLNSLEMALNNTVVYRNLVNCGEAVEVTGRAAGGSFEIEALLVATKDIWTQISSAGTSAINVTHGTAVGNRVQLISNVAQVTNPSFTDQDNIVLVSGDLRLVPTAANNEFSLVIT